MIRRALPVLLGLALLTVACGSDDAAPPPGAPSPVEQPELPGSWSTRPRMGLARSELGAAVIGGKAYVVGGLNEGGIAYTALEVYDPATDTWTTAPSMPEGRHHAGVAAVDGKLYVLGGYPSGDYPWPSTRTVQVFDPASGTWEQRAPMPRARGAFTAAVVDGRIHCIGGEEGPLHEAYDPATDSWETLPALPEHREHLASAVIGSRIYVVGGRVTQSPYNFGGTTENSAALEVYDVATGTWSTLARMPTSRGGLGAAALGGRLYAFGGEFPSVFPQVEEYDPEANTWRSMRPMPTPRHGIATAVLDGRIHVFGGGIHFGFSDSTTHEAFVP